MLFYSSIRQKTAQGQAKAKEMQIQSQDTYNTNLLNNSVICSVWGKKVGFVPNCQLRNE